jgi:hypothetical protein
VKLLGWVIGVVTLLATGAYLFVYIYRWEWHRALLVGVLFLAAMLALGTGLVLRRLGRLEQSLRSTQSPAGASDAVLRRLREAPGESRPFPWLRPESLEQTHVFIPILLGGGVVVSALAWLVERVAGSSAREGVETELAGELTVIGYPAAPLVPTDAELLAGDGAVDDPRLRLLLGPAGQARGRR